MREVKLETIIISKEAWKYLRNKNRITKGFAALIDEQLEKAWSKIRWRNGGASNETYPIKENEVRIERDTFSIRWDSIKDTLKDNCFDYRIDGFIQEAIYC